MKKTFTILTVLIYCALFYASKSVSKISKDVKTYSNVSKIDKKDTTVSVSYPILLPINNTKQELTKGGVTVSCEIVPFDINKTTNQNREIFYADPSKPGFDIYQTANIPAFSVTPDRVSFNLKIKNKQSHLLKMREVALVMLIDGIQYSWPKTFIDEEWQSGMIVSGFEKSFNLPGPKLENLKNAKVINIFLNDLPVSYDQAGNVSKRENFEWTFQANIKTENRSEPIIFTYETEPVHKEQCISCSGSGKRNVSCTACGGDGIFTFDGKNSRCNRCNGSGKVAINCSVCGGMGFLSYPKSKLPEVSSLERWNGHIVTVRTIPDGATVSIYDVDAKKYLDQNALTPIRVNWLRNSSEDFPIIISLNGKKVKVMPFKKGKASNKILIDFTPETPFVKIGTEQ